MICVLNTVLINVSMHGCSFRMNYVQCNIFMHTLIHFALIHMQSMCKLILWAIWGGYSLLWEKAEWIMACVSFTFYQKASDSTAKFILIIFQLFQWPLDNSDSFISTSACRDQSQLPDVVLRGDQSFGATDQISCRVCGVSFSVSLNYWLFNIIHNQAGWGL